MTIEKFVDKNFRADTLEVIAKAAEIIADYSEQGFTLTLRQLYYQFVARGLRENTEKSYKTLGKIISEARLAGLLPWDGIEDRGRSLSAWHLNENEQSVFRGIERQLALDLWEAQGIYVEAWIEKDALSSVLKRPCGRYRVPYMACKGYLSASEAYRSGKRFEEALSKGASCVLLHLGDHDPSGIDMTRDNEDRLMLLSNARLDGMEIEVRRLALNMDQVQQYRPPPNPAKITDSRSDEYIRRFGRVSWELDALDPSVIDDLVSAALDDLIDPDIWDEKMAEEKERRAVLSKVYRNWPSIRNFIEKELPS